MKNKKFTIAASEIVLALLGILFLVGILTLFAPCGPKDDGSWMTCHWAGRAETGLAAVITVIAILHILIPDGKIKLGLDIALIPTTVLATALPVNLINLCGMEMMRCHTVMHPAVIVISILTLIFVAIDIFIQRKKTQYNKS